MTDQMGSRPDVVVTWPKSRRPRGRLRYVILAIAAAVFIGGSTTLSYYVEALWYDSLGYSPVFWTTLNLQALVFGFFSVATFAVLYGAFRALKPANLGEFPGVIINGKPLT